MREPDGRITEFNVPGSTISTEGECTVAASITPNGTIAGYYYDAKNRSLTHAFVRLPNGKFITFDVPPGEPGGVAYSIGPSYAVAGITADLRGFERFANGKLALFAAPNAILEGYQPAPNYGTRVSANNAYGAVSGWYFDSAGLSHGFVWTP